MQRSVSDVGVDAVADRLERRLAESPWTADAPAQADVEAAAEIATFALRLSGKQRTARRLKRLIVRFALAACLALAACSKPDAGPEATAVAISQLPTANGTEVALGAQSPRGSPGRFTNLTLVDPGSDQRPWAIALPKGGNSPVLIDPVGSGMTTPGTDYNLAAQPINVGTRDGPSQFLDPLTPADSSGTEPPVQSRDQLVGPWGEDERYVAVTRAIAGQPTVLDAAYNAAAAVAAGGTHTYSNGVVLRVEPDQPVIQVIDRNLLESGKPTRAEDVVYVAIRDSERALYDPGTVVNLRDVVMTSQNIDVNGQSQTVFVANAALQGARVEPTDHVDLQSLLQPRLQRVDGDLAAEAQEAGTAGTPALATPGPSTQQPTATAPLAPVQQPVIVNQSRGPSFIDDFLIWMWLSNSGFYRGNTVIINNPPPSPYRTGNPGGYYYSAPPPPSSSTPSTAASAQAASRSTAIQASRSAVSGQAAGTGGGVAATNKSAADESARVSAATSKAASAAGSVSSASAGKSISSASPPSSSSSSASRSAGSTSAGTRGSASTSSGSSSTGSKGIGGASSSSGSSGGFGGRGASGGSSSS
ncbi:MAG: hypothetical protein JOZ81_04500 [Chloroflexi bacterium]|nr:hypothetical protein [Chloroflexota bacterium]